MGELSELPARTGAVDLEQAQQPRMLANSLLQRRLQIMNRPGGIPSTTHKATVLVQDPRTGRFWPQVWEFRGPMLAVREIDGDTEYGPARLQVILGITGQYIELRSFM